MAGLILFCETEILHELFYVWQISDVFGGYVS